MDRARPAGPPPEPTTRAAKEREDRVEAVLAAVEGVPSGRATTYGAIADVVAGTGARRVGRVLAEFGGLVPWWRVVRADGTLPHDHQEAALEQYRREGTPLRRAGGVDLVAAFWSPAASAGSGAPASAPGGGSG